MARQQVAAAAAVAAIAGAAAVLASELYSRRCRRLATRVRELEASLAAATEKAAAERRGRSLRKALSEQELSSDEKKKLSKSPKSFPMASIGVVQSCFSTRNGTPRQPLVVPLARATVMLDPARVPAEALEGLADYSHCWILYVFHLNTDLDKMWNDPARSKLKAKVRVPRLKGGKMGVLATRSPHRPNPIGLSVAKKKQSLYASADEFQDLVKEVLSWDIRSLSQRIRPHDVTIKDVTDNGGSKIDNDCSNDEDRQSVDPSTSVVYHLHLEGIDVSYRIDQDSNIVVENAALLSSAVNQHRYSYLTWREKKEFGSVEFLK
uniref:TsaA-like domain-containing protein n=1 Tax=Oryza barthii TaxID=65489 RepID=A0A0D3H742_9ORYZ